MIRLAIQSKGRLNEDSLRLLREIGINIDDAKVLDELQEMTQDVYQANRTKGSKLGKGGKGKGKNKKRMRF